MWFFALVMSANMTVSAQGGCPMNMTDVDGNSYPVVQIGNQCWMANNLATARYANGDSIPHVPYAWYAQTNGAWCAYDNLEANDTLYGKLYNWFTVADTRSLCPTGWHMPTDADWYPVINTYGGASTAGGALKAVSPLWLPPNADATNSSGFTGLPGGVRSDMGSFINVGTDGFFWSATDQQSTSAWSWHLHHDWGGVDHGGVLKQAGLSCRCVYDQLVGIEEDRVLPLLAAFPNPTTGMVQVDLQGAIANYEVFDAFGRSATRGRLQTGLNAIDLTACAPGVYHLQVEGAAGSVRVVKE